MQDQEYEMLVWGLQGEAQDRPGMFRTKVVLISLFAYLVLFSLLVLLVLGLYFMFGAVRGNGSVLSKMFLVSWLLAVVPIVLLTLRMFLARIPVPAGRELTEGEAPQLFATVSAIRERLQGAPI